MNEQPNSSVPSYEGAGWHQDKTTKKWRYYYSMCICLCHKDTEHCVLCDNDYADLCSPVLASNFEAVYSEERSVPLKFREWD